ncbi:MAG: ribosome-associated translation inhibitor RaiA [Betaproteobacteria bacterium]|nr:ribosome-associated translation inhibitor RaiA [Betaproteobacteria bacterium]
MNLTVSGHHVAVTQALASYVRGKLDRVRRHVDHVIDVSAILSANKLRQKAEVTLHVRGKDIFAETDDGDLYAAIDLVADKLDRQILRHKDRLRSHPHNALKHQRAEFPDSSQP